MAQKMAKYFITAALFFLILGCLEGIMFPTKMYFKKIYSTFMHIQPEYLKPFFIDFVKRIHAHITLIGWVSSALMGILYYLVPKIQGDERYRVWACYANFWCHIAGIVLFCAGFHLIGSFGLATGFAHGTNEFRKAVTPFKPIVITGGLLIITSAFLFSYNIIRTFYGKDKPI